MALLPSARLTKELFLGLNEWFILDSKPVSFYFVFFCVKRS